MMKHRILQFLSDTGEQIVSTCILGLLILITINGMIATVKDPPSTIVIAGVAAFGFLLGAIKYFTDEKLTKDLDSKNNLED